MMIRMVMINDDAVLMMMMIVSLEPVSRAEGHGVVNEQQRVDLRQHLELASHPRAPRRRSRRSAAASARRSPARTAPAASRSPRTAAPGGGGRGGAGPICAASRRQQQQLHARSPVRGRLRDRPVRPVAAPGAPHLEAGAHRGRDAVSPTPNSRCPTARQGHTGRGPGAQCPVPLGGAQVCCVTRVS